jgi:ketosteroid isomerase-like protein
MSHDNLATLRDQIDALVQGDFERWLQGFDPEVEFRMPPEWPDESIGKGPAAALASMKGTLELAEGLEIDLREVTELGDPDRLLIYTHIAATAIGSGVPVEFDRYDLMTMRNGKVFRDEIYLTREQAFEAAGLPE